MDERIRSERINGGKQITLLCQQILAEMGVAHAGMEWDPPTDKNDSEGNYVLKVYRDGRAVITCSMDASLVEDYPQRQDNKVEQRLRQCIAASIA